MYPLAQFSPGTRTWFERTFAAPTPAQAQGWPAIASGSHVLIQAPTGSGKTLTAFLSAIDRLNGTPGTGVRLLDVSPLKALNYDIERNLRGPLAGVESTLRVGVRTGDTPEKERRELLREPPDILITTPESLYLMLTSQARESLRGVETLILDEVHAVAGTKRGAHLALSVERLEALCESATAADRPLGDAAAARGDRQVRQWRASDHLVDAGTRKELDLEVVIPVEDMRELGQTVSYGTHRRPTAARCSRRPRAARTRSGRRSTPSPASRRGAPLDDRLREQPPSGRAARASPE